NVVQCKYCDATMTYHRTAGANAQGATLAEGVHTGHLHCHYCLAVQKLPDKCPVCSKKLSLFGLGTQRVEEALRSKFPALKSAGRVVLQTFLPDDPAIQAAIRQDYAGFAKAELAHRREVGLPPFSRMVRIVLRDEDRQRLHKRSEALAARLAEAVARERGEV